MGFSLGAGFNNIGSKMSYTNTNQKDFLPMNMQLGAMFSPGFKWGKFRLEFDLAYQVTKLLVPTPPEYALDVNGNPVLDANNNRVIAAGMDPNVSVPVAFFWHHGRPWVPDIFSSTESPQGVGCVSY